MTQGLVLKNSLFNYLGLVPLLGLIVLLVPEVYPIGALLGVLAAGVAHIIWARKAKFRDAKTPKPEEERASTQA
jgi:hypothetical protein